MGYDQIATDFPYTSHYVEVDNAKIHYIEQGQGNPILFLHGIPTSCYIWRNIIPTLTPLGRCIAPDLLGFGKSAKCNINYSIVDHIYYIEQFIKALDLKNIILVMHGWGSLIGFDYAMRQPANCKGLAFYEAFLRPVQQNAMSLPYAEQLLMLQQLQKHHSMVNEGAYFVEQILRQTNLRSLTETELAYYRQPFALNNSGQPLYQYFLELPQGKGNLKTDELIADYSKKLMQSTLPKLMLYSMPGFIMTMETVMWAKENLKNIEINDLGEALHYAQEVNPTLMAKMISLWLQGLI